MGLEIERKLVEGVCGRLPPPKLKAAVFDMALRDATKEDEEDKVGVKAEAEEVTATAAARVQAVNFIKKNKK